MTPAVAPALDRRRFIGVVAGAAGAGLLAGPGRGLLDALPFVGGDAPFTRPAVLDHLGETFRITDGPAAGARLVLDAVAELPNVVRAVLPDDQFAARFVAGAGVELVADTYVFRTSSFGELPLFVAPLVDTGGVTVGYEAIVDRYVPAAAAPAVSTGGRQ